MAKLFDLSRVFGRGAEDTKAAGAPQFFSEKPQNKDLCEKARAVTFVKGAGYNNLVTDSFNIPIEADETKSAHTRLKLARQADGHSWEIIKTRRFDLGSDDSTGLNDKVTEETVGTAPCLYDALHFCAEFEKGFNYCRKSAAGKDYEGVKHWRKAAADAGQVVDMDGALALCVEGKTLTKIGPYSRDQEKILNLTRKPDPEEPGIFDKLLSGTSSTVQTQTATRQSYASLEAHQSLEACRDRESFYREAKHWFVAILIASVVTAPLTIPIINDLFLNSMGSNQDPSVSTSAENQAADINRELLETLKKTKDRDWYSTEIKIKELLDQGANPNIQTTEANTPLHLAVDSGQLGVIELLLEKGANPNAQNNDGLTPLHLAAIKNRVDIARVLYKKGADPTIKDNLKKKTPMAFAPLINPEFEAQAATRNFLESVTHSKPDTSSMTRFTITGDTCEIRGDVINLSAGRDASTYPLPTGCSLIPR